MKKSVIRGLTHKPGCLFLKFLCFFLTNTWEGVDSFLGLKKLILMFHMMCIYKVVLMIGWLTTMCSCHKMSKMTHFSPKDSS